MDRMIELKETVQLEVADYSRARDWKAKSYYLENPANDTFTVVVPNKDHPFIDKPRFIVMARIVEDKVVINENTTDRPVYEEQMRAGVPREQIVLAYAGEKLPSEESPK